MSSYSGSKMDMSTDQKGPTGISSGQDLSKRQGLIAVNDLTYVLEPDLSVASNKTHKVHYFQNSTYTPNQNAICILNSGADYIDTRRSWLQFDVELSANDVDGNALQDDDASRAQFGEHGSACNLIRQITVSTRSGDVLCQLFDFNLMNYMLLPVTYDKGWVDSVGQTMAYAGSIRPTRKNRFLIPMYVLSPLFAYGRLMPAMLMSGLRIEIVWEDVKDAVYNSTVPPQSYTVSDPQFCLSSVQLSDSIQRALNELSATNGLEIVYCDYERDMHTSGDALTSLNMEIRKSCSRALKAFARVRIKTATGGLPNKQNRDTFAAESGFPIYEYQWRLGSLYFPQQPVRAKTPDANGCRQTSVNAYAHLLESVDKYHGGSRAPVLSMYGVVADVSGYANSTTVDDQVFVGSYQRNQHTVGVTLERSTMFNLAGIPVNNSRVLAFQAKLVDTTGDAALVTPVTRQVDVFLKYVRLARVFLNNVEVEQ